MYTIKIQRVIKREERREKMKHRVLAILLSLCLLVGLFPTVALAADDTWSDVVTEKPEGYAEDV